MSNDNPKTWLYRGRVIEEDFESWSVVRNIFRKTRTGYVIRLEGRPNMYAPGKYRTLADAKRGVDAILLDAKQEAKAVWDGSCMCGLHFYQITTTTDGMYGPFPDKECRYLVAKEDRYLEIAEWDSKHGVFFQHWRDGSPIAMRVAWWSPLPSLPSPDDSDPF